MSQRAARSSTSASASIHWIAWRWLRGAPNVDRCLAWAIAMRWAAAATPPAVLDRAGGIRAAARLGDREKGVIALAQRRHRVPRDLLLRPAPDHGRRVAPEDAAPGVVEAHSVLGHLLEEQTHGEGAEAAAAVLLGRAETPEPGRLGLGHEPAIVVRGQLGGVRIDALLDGDDLVTDEAAHLGREGQELVGEPEAVERGHRRAASALRIRSRPSARIDRGHPKLSRTKPWPPRPKVVPS